MWRGNRNGCIEREQEAEISQEAVAAIFQIVRCGLGWYSLKVFNLGMTRCGRQQ